VHRLIAEFLDLWIDDRFAEPLVKGLSLEENSQTLKSLPYWIDYSYSNYLPPDLLI